MNKNVRTAAASVLITATLLLTTASAAFAAPPLSVHIEVLEFIAQSGESFAASGAAVDAGMLCPSGEVYDVSTVISGPAGGAYNILHVLKHFECSDASGTFNIRLIVRLDNATHETTASWQVVEGTGDYAGLHGNGSLVGTPVVAGESIYDVYDGQVH